MSEVRSQLPRGDSPVLFYDGECGFCNGSVCFVLRHESRPVLLFAPLQGTTATQALQKSNLPATIGEQTIVLMENKLFLVRSRAALRVMHHMGGIWAILSRLFAIVPSSVADAVYNFVARNRKHLPQGDSCTLLPPDQRKRFLP